MMGHQLIEQAAVFYEFSLERHVPADHLLRSIDRFLFASIARWLNAISVFVYRQNARRSSLSSFWVKDAARRSTPPRRGLIVPGSRCRKSLGPKCQNTGTLPEIAAGFRGFFSHKRSIHRD